MTLQPRPKMPTSHKPIMPQLVPIGKRLPAYIKLSWLLAFEPSIPLIYRSGLYLTVLYIVSPAHFAMNVIPVLGQIDWILLLMFSIRLALTHCPPTVLARLHLKVNLEPGQLQKDIDTLSSLCKEGMQTTCERVPAVCNMGRKVALAGRQVAFAGRVANGFTRRVVNRMRTEYA